MSGVVVTGGASGIGLASAKALIADGRAVSLFDISPQVVAVAEALGAHGVVVDVSDTGSMAAAVGDDEAGSSPSTSTASISLPSDDPCDVPVDPNDSGRLKVPVM